jgi:hypothetical protein
MRLYMARNPPLRSSGVVENRVSRDRCIMRSHPGPDENADTN